MTFNHKLLYNNEEVVIDRHPHWIFLTPSGLALVAACALGIVSYAVLDDGGLRDATNIGAAALIVAALVWFLIRLVKWRTTQFVVTTERCIYRHGVFSTAGIEIPLDRINTVFFNQTFFERMLRAGDLAIESAGENSRQEFGDIYDPVKVQNTIYQLMEDNENRKYDRIGANAQGVVGGAALSVAEQIEKLADLHQRGVITDEQFESQKTQLLGG